MPNMGAGAVKICEQVLGLVVVKVKVTDDPDVGLALIGDGRAAWVNIKTREQVRSGSIGGVKNPPGARFNWRRPGRQQPSK